MENFDNILVSVKIESKASTESKRTPAGNEYKLPKDDDDASEEVKEACEAQEIDSMLDAELNGYQDKDNKSVNKHSTQYNNYVNSNDNDDNDDNNGFNTDDEFVAVPVEPSNKDSNIQGDQIDRDFIVNDGSDEVKLGQSDW